jgi:hypothetical protein
MTGMLPSDPLSVFAAIGVFVVTLVVLLALYVAGAWLLVGGELLFGKLSVWAFHLGGGVVYDDGDAKLPRPPWDRLWVELLWLASVVRWVEARLGYYDWGNVGGRPDIERLHELRNERGD